MNELVERYKTHAKRYELISKRLGDHFALASFTGEGYTDKQDYIKHIELLNEALEALMDMNGDLGGMIKELESAKSIMQTALKIYAEYYGSELVVPEGFVKFDKNFHMTTSVIPTEGKTTITIEVEDIDDN